MSSVSRQPAQTVESQTQNNRSTGRSFGRGWRRLKTASCCLRARFSRARSRCRLKTEKNAEMKAMKPSSILPTILRDSREVQCFLQIWTFGDGQAESTVAKYRIKSPKPSSQTWKAFLSNHTADIIGIDFVTVPTATFRNLYCFIILSHERRQVVHFNVTEYPTAIWTARQTTSISRRDWVFGRDNQKNSMSPSPACLGLNHFSEG